MTNLNYITALFVIVILFHGCHTGNGSDLFNKQEIYLKERALHYWDKRVNKNDAEKAFFSFAEIPRKSVHWLPIASAIVN